MTNIAENIIPFLFSVLAEFSFWHARRTEKKPEESEGTREYSAPWFEPIWSSLQKATLQTACKYKVWFEKKTQIKVRIYHISQSLFQEMMQAKSAAKWASQKYSATHSIV